MVEKQGNNSKEYSKEKWKNKTKTSTTYTHTLLLCGSAYPSFQQDVSAVNARKCFIFTNSLSGQLLPDAEKIYQWLESTSLHAFWCVFSCWNCSSSRNRLAFLFLNSPNIYYWFLNRFDLCAAIVGGQGREFFAKR